MKLLSWQQSHWQTLTQRIAQNKIPHAMLFHGPQGVGKSQFVSALVARLLCAAPVANQACGKCESCHLLSVNNHPDLRLVSCEENKKNISVDQIRNVIEYVSLTPHSAKYKVAVINQAERMTINAANSALKTLEEPPKSALIFLITHRPEQLLPTILSRCQKTLFKIPTHEEADQWLAQHVDDHSRRQALLALANGAPLKAMEYEHQGIIEQRQKQFETLLNLINGKLDPVSAADVWLKLDLELSLYSMISWIVDLARLKSSQQPPKIMNSDFQQNLLNLKDKASLQGILQYHAFLYECLDWSKSNVNTQLLLEDMLIRWIKLFR